jgi:predicted PurR-regulated permease PerM
LKERHVLALDDRTGNVLTTIGLFAIVSAVLYAARATIVAVVLALLLAYLLEPAVDWVQRLFPRLTSGRAVAIGVVYLVLTSMALALGHAMEPEVARQLRRLNAALPDMLARLADQPLPLQSGTSIAAAVERLIRAATAAADHVGSLLMAPIIAVFLLLNRSVFMEGTVDLFARCRDRTSVKRTVEQVDAVLAQYMRAQFLLSVLSVAFYSLSMAALGFPYALVLGVLGGALEFVPVVGWISAAAVILTSGWLAHANWIAMAGLLLIWRIVQNLVNVPRIMGDQLEMDPLTVLMALMAGGQIGGLLGVVLSVPVVAVLRILWGDRASRQKAEAA